MKKSEAKTALDNGEILTHRYFDENEYVFKNKTGFYQFEDGVSQSPDEFWLLRNNTGWDEDWFPYEVARSYCCNKPVLIKLNSRSGVEYSCVSCGNLTNEKGEKFL